MTALLRYQLDDRWSAHGGLRAQWFDASVALGGLSAGPFDDYTADIKQDLGLGFVLGGTYEIPDIALRVALTYNSKVRYDTTVVEGLPADVGGPTTTTSAMEFETPQSLNLDFQTGVAEDTLLFGSVRWVDWSSFSLSPAEFSGIAGEPLADYPHDIITYSLGVGRQLTDTLFLAAFVNYEDERNRNGSALGPVNGYTSISLAAIHETDKMRLSLGLAYYWLRDADPQSGDETVGSFCNDRLMAVELKVGFKL